MHLLQITTQHRRHSPLHQGGLPPGDEPGLGADVMGTDHRAETELPQPSRTGLFMAGIPMGMQQGHHSHIDALADRVRKSLT